MSYKDQLIELETCRICKRGNLRPFLSLGSMPLANNFLQKKQLNLPEPYYPLDVCFCDNCKLVQLKQVVTPEILFKRYPYITGASEPLKSHFALLSRGIIDRFQIVPGSLIIDIGSNDGTLLNAFQKSDMTVLGIEPAINLVKLARSRGISTIHNFFTNSLAQEIRTKRGGAKIITAINVFAHIHDLHDFLNGIHHLLDKNGILIIEVPYLVDLIEKTAFDTIYHEHLSYFNVHPLVALINQFDMNIIDIERIGSAGGSIRLYIDKSQSMPSTSVSALLGFETEKGFCQLETYRRFAKSLSRVKKNLVSLLQSLKTKDARIAGYGAAAKGNILLNYCKIGTDILDYIIDTTPLKQGLYSPGAHIPIYPEEYYYQRPPDYFLLLAWNYAEEIIAKEYKYHEQGGKFIVPIPEPHII